MGTSRVSPPVDESIRRVEDMIIAIWPTDHEDGRNVLFEHVSTHADLRLPTLKVRQDIHEALVAQLQYISCKLTVRLQQHVPSTSLTIL